MTTTPITPASVRITVSSYDAALETTLTNKQAAERYEAAIQTAYPLADVSIGDGADRITVWAEDEDGDPIDTDRIAEHCRHIVGTVWMQLCEEVASEPITPAMQNAIDAIDGDVVANGTAVRYYDDAMQLHYVAPMSDIPRLVVLLAQDETTGYSLWCAETDHGAGEEV